MNASRLLSVFLLGCYASAEEPAPAFSVASVKPVDIARFAGASLSPEVNPGSFRCLCSVQTLVLWAYKLKRDQVGFPAGLKDADIYEVRAKFPEGSSSALPAMMRHLLEQRFHFAAHRESRLTAIYAMVVDKHGLKLKPSRGPASLEEAIAAPPRSKARVTIAGRLDRLNVTGSGTLDEIAELLKLDRPVVNMTGVSGRFDYAIDALVPPKSIPPLILQNGNRIPASVNEPGPGDPGSIFSEIKKLGLVLEPRKSLSEYLAIDHVDKQPTAN